jgi:hypothetical protein
MAIYHLLQEAAFAPEDALYLPHVRALSRIWHSESFSSHASWNSSTESQWLDR